MPDGAPRIAGFYYRGVHRYSLTICAHARLRVFSDRKIVDAVLAEIRHAAADGGFRILAYCFMPDHLHLLVQGESDDADLRQFVKAWKQKSAFHHAKTTGRRLWQVGFFDHVLRSDESTYRHVLYVLGNPERAGLSRTIGEYPFAGCEPGWLEAAGDPQVVDRKPEGFRLPGEPET